MRCSALLFCILAFGIATQLCPQLATASADTQHLSPAANATLSRFIAAIQNGSDIDFRDISLNHTAWFTDLSAATLFPETHSLEELSSSLTSAIAKALVDGLRSPARDMAGVASDQLESPGRTDGFEKRRESSQDLTLTESLLEEQAFLKLEEVPGITAIVYQDFFSKASAVAIQLLQENFKKVKLDTVTAIAKVPVLGDFDIKLENVQLEGISLDKSSTGVKLGTDGSFELDVANMDAVVSGHFQWRRTRFPFISGGCQAQVTAVNGNVQLSVAAVVDPSGRPMITNMDAAHLSFDSLTIVTSGAKLSWLYNAVAAFAHTQIQNAITRAVGKQVSTTVPAQINVLLQGVPTIVRVKGLDLNTSLAKDPEVSPDRLILWDWGRFQNPRHQFQACPFAREVDLASGSGPILPGGSPYQIIVNIDESIVNCLTWDMFLTNKLHAFLVGDDLPEQALYTDSWRFVIPAVWAKCPGCPMAVNATVTTAPETQILKSEGITSKGSAELSFYLASGSEGRSRVSSSSKPASSSKADAHNSDGLQSTELGSAETQGRQFRQDSQSIEREPHSKQARSTSSSGVASMLGIEIPDQSQTLPRGSDTYGGLGKTSDVGGSRRRLLQPDDLKGPAIEASTPVVGDHLFTLSLSGELSVRDLTLDPDPVENAWRLNLAVKINQGALKVGVVESDVGAINEAALHFALTVASFLVEDKINHGILADGFQLPDIPHINVDRANVTVADYGLAIGADFSYVK